MLTVWAFPAVRLFLDLLCIVMKSRALHSSWSIAPDLNAVLAVKCFRWIYIIVVVLSILCHLSQITLFLAYSYSISRYSVELYKQAPAAVLSLINGVLKLFKLQSKLEIVFS